MLTVESEAALRLPARDPARMPTGAEGMEHCQGCLGRSAGHRGLDVLSRAELGNPFKVQPAKVGGPSGSASGLPSSLQLLRRSATRHRRASSTEMRSRSYDQSQRSRGASTGCRAEARPAPPHRAAPRHLFPTPPLRRGGHR